MKHLQKTFFSFLIVLLLLIFNHEISEAQSKKDLEKNFLDSLNATMIDNETGEEVELTPEIEEIKDFENFSMDSNQTDHSEEIGYKVFFPIEEEVSNDEIGTFDVDEGSTQQNGVTAEISVYYTTRGDYEMRAQAVYGGWTSDYSLSERFVRVAHGQGFVERDEFSPTSNSFYYFLDWEMQEYVDFGDFQPVAFSSAVISEGPASGNTIELLLNFG